MTARRSGKPDLAPRRTASFWPLPKAVGKSCSPAIETAKHDWPQRFYRNPARQIESHKGSFATYADLCSGASGHPTRSSGRRRSPLAKSSCNPSRLFHRTTAQLRASCLFMPVGMEGDLISGNRSELGDRKNRDSLKIAEVQ